MKEAASTANHLRRSERAMGRLLTACTALALLAVHCCHAARTHDHFNHAVDYYNEMSSLKKKLRNLDEEEPVMKQSLENEVLDDRAVIKKIKHFEVKEANLENVEASRLKTLKAKLAEDKKKEKETAAVVEADSAKVKKEQDQIDSIEKKVKKGKELEYREEGDFKASLKALKSMLRRNPDGTSQVVPLTRHRRRRRRRHSSRADEDDDDGADSDGDSDAGGGDDDTLGGIDIDEQPRKRRRARSSDADDLEGTNTALDDVDEVLGTGTSGTSGGGGAASSSVDLDDLEKDMDRVENFAK